MASTKYIDVFTPDSVIAAALPYASESPREVAYNNAAYALDREDVHMIYTSDNEMVYYVASASEDFAGHMSSVTPLAAALPGATGHRGDGAYVAIAESGYAVVVKKGNEMYSYVGDRQAVDAFIASHKVDTYSTTENTAMPWEGYNLGKLRRANEIAKKTIVMGSIFAVIAAFVWFGIANIGSDLDAEAASLRTESENSIKQAADDINKFSIQPVILSLRKLQEIITRTTKYNGFVTFYEISGGENISWEIELPGWVTSDMIEEFGRNLNVNKDEDRNIIVVRSGEPTSNVRGFIGKRP